MNYIESQKTRIELSEKAMLKRYCRHLGKLICGIECMKFGNDFYEVYASLKYKSFCSHMKLMDTLYSAVSESKYRERFCKNSVLWMAFETADSVKKDGNNITKLVSILKKEYKRIRSEVCNAESYVYEPELMEEIPF